MKTNSKQVKTCVVASIAMVVGSVGHVVAIAAAPNLTVSQDGAQMAKARVVIVGAGKIQGICNFENNGRFIVTLKNLGNATSKALPVTINIDGTQIEGMSAPLSAQETVKVPMSAKGTLKGGDWDVTIKIPGATAAQHCVG